MKSTPPDRRLEFRFNGATVPAVPGQTIAAALLAAGHVGFRKSAVSDAMHGPYCLMGACFECLVEVAGTGRRQACMIEARDGMEVTSA